MPPCRGYLETCLVAMPPSTFGIFDAFPDEAGWQALPLRQGRSSVDQLVGVISSLGSHLLPFTFAAEDPLPPGDRVNSRKDDR
jgi:hypothetical protein